MQKLLTSFGVAAALLAGTAIASAEENPIKLGHLSVHTGPYGHFGPHFDGASDFAIGLINENPPLGRPIQAFHQDWGTLGEGQVARRLVEQEGVDILYNISHNYESYRDWLLGFVAQNGRPAIPSVFAGSQRVEWGGTPEEPMFRGSPMDTAQAAAVAQHAQSLGATRVVIIASEDSGMQMSQDSAIKAAKVLGMEVLADIDIQTEQTSYRSEVARANSLNPDAILVFSQAEEGGIIVKNAAEMGMSVLFLGEPNWLAEEFPRTATMGAINRQKGVYIVGYTHSDSPAWDYFKEKWEASDYARLSPAGDSYTMQMYDMLNMTALAIEAAGTTDAREWANHVREVSMAPGKKVYSYAEGIAALKAGEDIDYEGVTGSYDYTDTGVVSGQFAAFSWNSPSEWEQTALIDGTAVLELDAAPMPE
ncbi:hypothetical protein JP75_04195 [Devosia riboflavina]|uniref:Leucine-binding protein domain-containing protein n=1 Tax=Devosia riboflavina TaxID=46914 RepID=A0A087M5M2_9HYPH|nr:ABC transporter substrate-binding protein [Devosia riboflavina]KFL32175.1 hypothetical protein JP75_04195 [Devosia riboflavina]